MKQNANNYIYSELVCEKHCFLFSLATVKLEIFTKNCGSEHFRVYEVTPSFSVALHKKKILS